MKSKGSIRNNPFDIEREFNPGTMVLGTSGQITATDNGDGTVTLSLATGLDALVYKGVIDCSGSPNYPAADSGHVYVVSVAGKIGGASGTVVAVGDTMFCNTDSTTAGTQAQKGAYWNIVEKNIDLTNVTISGGTITGTTVSGITLASGSNTFSLTVGSASLDIAATKVVDINENLTISGVTNIAGALDIATTKTVNIDDDVTVSAEFHVEAATHVNQDLTSDASPTFAGVLASEVQLSQAADTHDITAAEMAGQVHTITGAYTMHLPTAVAGYHATFVASTAAIFSIDLETGTDAIILGQTELTAGNKITSDGTQWARVHIRSVASGHYIATPETGLFIDGGA